MINLGLQIDIANLQVDKAFATSIIMIRWIFYLSSTPAEKKRQPDFEKLASALASQVLH